MSGRFVRIWAGPVDRGMASRLRVDFDPDFGDAILADENVLPEKVLDPDARRVDTLASITLSLGQARFLAAALAEMVSEMETAIDRDQAWVDRRRGKVTS